MTLPRTLEGDLREVLRAQRPPGSPSADLRARVLTIPNRVQARHPAFALLQRAGVPLAAAGLAAAAVLIAQFGLTRAPITGLPPLGGGGVVTGFDPAIEGPGFVTGIVPSAILLGLVVALLGGATALGTFLTPQAGTWRGRGLIVLGILGVAAGAWLVRFDVGLTNGGIGGGTLGYVEAPTGPLDQQVFVWVANAAPGEPTVGLMSVRNTSAVPVRIEGLVPAFQGSDDIGRWTAVWVPVSGPGSDIPSLDDVRPFEPVTLSPGDGLVLYIAGRAGSCAFGPTFDPARQYPDTEFAGYSVVGPQVTVAYSVFGIAATMAIDMAEKFAQPVRAGCSSSDQSGD